MEIEAAAQLQELGLVCSNRLLVRANAASGASCAIVSAYDDLPVAAMGEAKHTKEWQRAFGGEA